EPNNLQAILLVRIDELLNLTIGAVNLEMEQPDRSSLVGERFGEADRQVFEVNRLWRQSPIQRVQHMRRQKSRRNQTDAQYDSPSNFWRNQPSNPLPSRLETHWPGDQQHSSQSGCSKSNRMQTTQARQQGPQDKNNGQQ